MKWLFLLWPALVVLRLVCHELAIPTPQALPAVRRPRVASRAAWRGLRAGLRAGGSDRGALPEHARLSRPGGAAGLPGRGAVLATAEDIMIHVFRTAYPRIDAQYTDRILVLWLGWFCVSIGTMAARRAWAALHPDPVAGIARRRMRRLRMSRRLEHRYYVRGR